MYMYVCVRCREGEMKEPLCESMHARMRACVYVCWYMHMCVCVLVYAYVHMYVCVCESARVCLHVCVSVYI